MCGRFTLRTPTPVLIEHFGMGKIPELPPRFNIAPTQDVAVVRNSSDDDRQWAMLRWGLIPFWAKDASIGNRMINARGETVSEKPSFRHAFRHRRCLVAADGFYEWQKKGAKNNPIMSTLRNINLWHLPVCGKDGSPKIRRNSPLKHARSLPR